MIAHRDHILALPAFVLLVACNPGPANQLGSDQISFQPDLRFCQVSHVTLAGHGQSVSWQVSSTPDSPAQTPQIALTADVDGTRTRLLANGFSQVPSRFIAVEHRRELSRYASEPHIEDIFASLISTLGDRVGNYEVNSFFNGSSSAESNFYALTFHPENAAFKELSIFVDDYAHPAGEFLMELDERFHGPLWSNDGLVGYLISNRSHAMSGEISIRAANGADHLAQYTTNLGIAAERAESAGFHPVDGNPVILGYGSNGNRGLFSLDSDGISEWPQFRSMRPDQELFDPVVKPNFELQAIHLEPHYPQAVGLTPQVSDALAAYRTYLGDEDVSVTVKDVSDHAVVVESRARNGNLRVSVVDFQNYAVEPVFTCDGHEGVFTVESGSFPSGQQQLPYTLFLLPEGEAKATVISLHGGPASNYYGYIDEWDALFLNAGFNILKFDYTGSTGRGLDFLRAGYWQTNDQVANDVEAARRFVDQRFETSKTLLFGHSFGGHLAFIAASRNSYDGMLVVNPLLSPGVRTAVRQARHGLAADELALFERQVVSAPGQTTPRASPTPSAANGPIMVVTSSDDIVLGRAHQDFIHHLEDTHRFQLLEIESPNHEVRGNDFKQVHPIVQDFLNEIGNQ